MKRNICGILIDDLNKKQLITEITKRLKSKEKTLIYTPNPIMAEDAKKDPEFLSILNSSTYNIPDGNGLVIASRLLKTPIPERICGIDLAEALLAEPIFGKSGVFFYGGKEGTAQRAAESLKAKYPNLKICGTENGYIKDNNVIIDKISSSGASIVYVCLGSPKQEKWIHENASKLPSVMLFMGLGGSLDVWSGDISRAPKLFREHGAEWLWRMSRSPKRIKNLPKLVSFGFTAIKKGLLSMVSMHR